MFRPISLFSVVLLMIALGQGSALAAAPATPASAPASASVPTSDPHMRQTPRVLRYVSLKGSKANLRQGPGYNHRILWTYRHKGYPFAVINEFDVWRKLLAPDGTEGWMSSILLSSNRTVLVTGKGRASITGTPGGGKVVALADPGAVADLKTCNPTACRISGQGIDGWISRKRIWGVGKDEVFQK
jgi:SH3-like domain-containing protein